MGEEDDSGRYMSTLGRGLRIVEMLAEQPRGLRDLSVALGTSRSTAYRLVSTLMHHRFVVGPDEGDRYSVGPRVWELGFRGLRFEHTFYRAREVVRSLSAQYGETVHLGTYDEGEVIYVDKAEGNHEVLAYTKLGGRAPSYAVSTGKVLLAAQTSWELERVISRGLVRYTPRTLVDPNELRRALAEAKAAGFATNAGEWRADVGGVAVPIRDPLGNVELALGFSGPIERIRSNTELLLEALRKGARVIAGER